jgi:hypothetical protein
VRLGFVIVCLVFGGVACSCNETPAATSNEAPPPAPAPALASAVGAWEGTAQTGDITLAVLLDVKADGSFWRLEYVAADRVQIHEGTWTREDDFLVLKSSRAVEHSARGAALQEQPGTLAWTLTDLNETSMSGTYEAPALHTFSLTRSEPAKIEAERARHLAKVRNVEDPKAKLFARMKAAKRDMPKLLAQIDRGELDAVGSREAVLTTVLCNAAAMDDTEGVEMILKRGIDVDAVDERNPSKPTPLICAAMMGATETTTQLLARGADPNAKDVRGNKASYWAQRKEHTELVQKLTAAEKAGINKAGASKPAAAKPAAAKPAAAKPGTRKADATKAPK